MVSKDGRRPRKRLPANLRSLRHDSRLDKIKQYINWEEIFWSLSKTQCRKHEDQKTERNNRRNPILLRASPQQIRESQ